MEKLLEELGSLSKLFADTCEPYDRKSNKWNFVKCIILKKLIASMKAAWKKPCSQHRLANSICDAFQVCKIPKLLASACDSDSAVKFLCAELLIYCLNENNIEDILDNCFPVMESLACTSWPKGTQMNAALIERLFMHSEEKCESLVQRGCLDVVLNACHENDTETLRHGAKALVNLSLYGGTVSQKAITECGLERLLKLGFHNDHKDDYIAYYSCLTFCVLVTNTEIQKDIKIEIEAPLKALEKFLDGLDPFEFATLNFCRGHDQSRNWLQRVVPLFHSKYQAARAVAAFHFAMEANNNTCQCGTDTQMFRRIGAVDALKIIARCAGESDVALRFARQALVGLGETSSENTKWVFSPDNSDGDENSREYLTTSSNEAIDVFISYRRSNGSHLASLLRDCLQSKFHVFVDINELGVGRFDQSLLRSIRQAKTFVLVLTPGALDRCIGDEECKDWIHKEVVAAMESGCKIIPVVDDFVWPEPGRLPEDMRIINLYNTINWVHEYQKETCLQKLERFIIEAMR